MIRLQAVTRFLWQHFFTTTPQDLIQAGLYKQLALACFPGKEDRKGSLATIAKLGLGAASSVHTVGELVRKIASTQRVASKGVELVRSCTKRGSLTPTIVTAESAPMTV